MRIFCPCGFTYAAKGDAVLLLALHDALRARYGPDAVITFSSFDPIGDAPRYGLPVGPQPLSFDPDRWQWLRRKAGRWWPLAPVLQAWAFLALAMVLVRTGLVRRPVVRRGLPSSWRWVFEQAVDADVVVAVPGGWFLAPRSTSLGHLTHIAAMAVAAAARTPIVLAPASVGPFVRPHRSLAAWILRRVDVVVLREPEADGVGVDLGRSAGPRIVHAPDMAFAFRMLPVEPHVQSPGERMRVGISVRRHNFPGAPPSERSQLWQRYLATVAEVTDRLQRDHDAEVVFVPQATGPYGHDPDISRLVVERCAETTHVTVIDDDLDLDDLQRLYASCDTFVGTRLHAAVIAARLGVPVVAVAYEPKAFALMDGMGLREFVISIDELDVATMLDMVLDASRRGAEQRASVKANEAALAEQATAWLSEVDRILSLDPAEASA